MSDITANVVVSMPSQLFTMARSFKAVANGKIYIGKIDTDPVNPENQIQVYVENEDGSHIPVAQPIIINAAGYPVYNGQIAKFVTVQGHSMAVYDAYGAQQFYFTNVLKYDPDQFRQLVEGSNGAYYIGYNNTNVGVYLNSYGIVVRTGSELKAAMEGASDGDVVIVDGDITLSQPIIATKAVSLKRSNGGRILWNGDSNNCISYIPPVKNIITTPVQFLQGTNTAILPADHSVVAGDFLEAHSTTVRHTDTNDGDYTFGQLFCVESVSGTSITFTPSVIEGFTSSEILVTDTLNNLEFDVEIKTIKPATGTATGILLDIHSARNLKGRFKITGNEDEQYGLALMGHNADFTAEVWSITSGAGAINVPGYGVNVVGSDIRCKVTGGKCRHVFDVPSRNVLSDNIDVYLDVIKSTGNPQFLYAAGWHANVARIKARGTIAGSGFLLGIRSGSGDVSMNFIGTDDGYNYSDIYVANVYPYSLQIHNCHFGGSNSRRNCVHWDTNGQTSNTGGLFLDSSTIIGPKRVFNFTDTSSIPTKVYRAYLSNCKGACSSIHNRNIPDSNFYLELFNNQLSSFGVFPTFPDYMAGVDSGGCKTYEIRSSNNYIEDSNTNGVFSFDGYMDAISLSSNGDKNGTKPFVKLTPTYLGRIERMDINGLSTSGLMTFTPVPETTYKDIGQVRFCRIGYNSPTPISIGLPWPIVFTGNSFNTTLDATLVSTKRPQAGNVNLSGKSLNWNGTNIAI
ncbi:TPA: phage head-binding domain-containing protein [Escherichia coli]